MARGPLVKGGCEGCLLTSLNPPDIPDQARIHCGHRNNS